MNVDNFKQHLISGSGKKGFSWREYEDYKGEGANIYTFCNLPNFPRCLIDVYLSDSTLQVVAQFDKVNNSVDTLKLINDFNAHCPFLKSFTAPVKDGIMLYVSSAQIEVADEESGLRAFFKIMDSLGNEGTQQFLRPLTILAK